MRGLAGSPRPNGRRQRSTDDQSSARRDTQKALVDHGPVLHTPTTQDASSYINARIWGVNGRNRHVMRGDRQHASALVPSPSPNGGRGFLWLQYR
jgi:hypothetical protein